MLFCWAAGPGVTGLHGICTGDIHFPAPFFNLSNEKLLDLDTISNNSITYVYFFHAQEKSRGTVEITLAGHT